jgi:iron complex outermembrane receptor protein
LSSPINDISDSATVVSIDSLQRSYLVEAMPFSSSSMEYLVSHRDISGLTRDWSKLDALQHLLPFGILFTNSDLKIEYVNPGFLSHFPFLESPLLGKDLRLVISRHIPPFPKKMLDFIFSIPNLKEPSTGEFGLSFPISKQIEIQAIPVSSETHDRFLFLCLDRTVNEIQHWIDTQRQIHAEISSLYISLSRILVPSLKKIQKMSHEGTSSDPITILKMIGDESSRLLLKLKELKHLGRHATENTWHEVDLNHVIQKIIHRLHPRIQNHNIKLKTRLTRHLKPLMVPSAFMERCIQAAMDNAVESIELKIQQQKGHPYTPRLEIIALMKGSVLELTVKDNGVGMEADQLKKASAPAGNLYQKQYEDMDAYTKTSFMGKLFFNITDDQELKLSYTANRSDDVLYPNSPMDALKDDSDLYNVEYSIKNLNSYSKKLDILYYYSKVDHPMSNMYKNAVKKMPEITNHMKSYIQGARVKNSFDLSDSILLTYGIDTSKRIWKGAYYKNGVFAGASLDNAVTKNRAVFVDALNRFDKNELKAGLRYDDTDITNSGNYNEPSFTSLNGYIFNTFHMNESTDLFAGVGISHRVPDGRELYFFKKGIVGNPNLDQTKNSEVDLGVRKNFENASCKVKLFYSKLDNYIYFNNSLPKNKFVNIDAKIYGAELSGAFLVGESLSFDYGVVYQRGKKDEPLAGQSDTDLADITPLRGTFTTNYDYDDKTSISLEIIAQKRWTHYDKDNGEQEIDGFATANFKLQRELMNRLDLTVGVDNIFNKTYASSNTYNDLTLVVAGGKQKAKLNEPGRYAYVNLSYQF